MNCWITLRSAVKQNKIPEHATCHRLQLLSKDRRKYYLHWDKCHPTITIDDDRVVVKFILGAISDCVDDLNVENGVFPEEVTSSFIKTSSILRIFSEVAETSEDARVGDLMDMEVETLEVSEDGVVFAFPLGKTRSKHWESLVN